MLRIRPTGYIKLWRVLDEWPPWRRMPGGQRSVVITMLWAANWRDETELIDGKFTIVPRGSLMASQRDIAELSGVGRQVARTALDALLANPGDGPFLTRELTQSGALYTVVNYDKYQGETDGPTQPLTRSQPRSQPGSNPLSIYEEVEEGKKGKTVVSPSSKKKKTKSAENVPSTTVLTYYYNQYKEKHGEPPMGLDWAGRDLQVAKKLLTGPPVLSPSDLESPISAYLALDDPYVAERGWPFALLPSRLAQLQAVHHRPRQRLKIGDPTE